MLRSKSLRFAPGVAQVIFQQLERSAPMRITKDMTIEEVVRHFPETVQVFSRYGVGCVGCSAAQYDNIEQGAVLHGLDIDQLVQELNACIAPHP